MPKFQHLVVDTTAFIRNVQLQDLAEKCYTVQAVLDEVRNDRQIRNLAVLPYDLLVKQVDPEALTNVIACAKKTGDFATLSLADLQVIALTYELQLTHDGREHLRDEPKPAITVSAGSKPSALHGMELLKGFYVPKRASKKKYEDLREGQQQEDDDGSDTTDVFVQNLKELKQKFSLTSFEEKQVEPEQSDSDRRVEQKDENQDPDVGNEENEKDEYAGKGSEDDDDEGDEDGDDGWITPSNIAQVKRDYGMDCLEESPSLVACITTDFAMQNVLKQLGLQVAALDGRVIRQVRTYILRCYACFKTTPDATKVFCPRCGNRTLKKVAVSIDADGQQVIHINSRRPLTAKYKNRPVAKFSGGKHSTNPLLYEDQPLPQQRISAKARSKTNALGDEYTAGYSPFVMRDVDSRSAVLRGSRNLKQWMTNIEYDNKRRGYRK